MLKTWRIHSVAVTAFAVAAAAVPARAERSCAAAIVSA